MSINLLYGQFYANKYKPDHIFSPTSLSYYAETNSLIDLIQIH